MIIALIISLVILAAAGLWLVATLTLSKRWLLTLLAAPLIMTAAVSLLYTGKSIMGRPLEAIPTDFVFLDYLVSTAAKKSIYMWYLDPTSMEPRTAKMPYSEQLHQDLEEAKQGKKHGQSVRGKLKKQGAEGGGAATGQEGGIFEFYSFKLQQVLPSKPPPGGDVLTPPASPESSVSP